VITVADWPATVLDNGTLRAVLLPGKGGELWELRHLPTETQVLWQAPWGLPRGPAIPAGAHFDDWYAGGWQDLLPNGDDACVVDGVRHAFHGESWALPWSARAVEDGVELAVELATVPLSVRRTVTLDGGTLRVAERVVHTGTEPATFMWGHHPALGGDLLARGCVIDLPGGTVENHHARVDHTSVLLPGARARWPAAQSLAGGTVDLSRLPGPDHGTHDVALVCDLVDGWYAVRNPERGVGFALRFPADVFRWLWIWQAYGGASTPPFGAETYTLAIEPWTSPPCLARATQRGEAMRLMPGEALDVVLEATVFTAHERVTGVGPRGAIRTVSS
jgi:hypothetical protein